MAFDDLEQMRTNVVATRRQFLKHAVVLGAAIPLGGALLAACGDDDDDGDEPAQPAATPAPADDDGDEEDEETPEPAPADDDDDDEDEDDEPADPGVQAEFVAAHPGPVYTLDAPVTWFGSTHNLAYMMYDCLVYDLVEGGGFEGQAAESWETSDDGLVWTFHLRDGLTYHNGEPLNAEAVKWNIDRVTTRDDFMVHPQWAFVDETTVVDDLTVAISTPTPHAFFLADVSFHGGQLLPPQYLEEVGEEEFARSPVGSGPYQLIEFTDNERYVFEAWDDYWAGPPEVHRVVIRVIPEQATQVAALLAGDIDFIPAIPEPDRERIANADGLDVVQAAPPGGIHLYPRQSYDAGSMAETYPDYELSTTDIRIRQAISHALDRELLAEVQGSGIPALIRMPPWEPAAVAEKYWDPELIRNWYDPDLSRQLIREAGYDPDAGNRPHIHFDAFALSYGNEREIAEVVQEMLEDVGFEVTLSILDLSAHREQIHGPGNNRDLLMVDLLTGGPSRTPLFYMCDWVTPQRAPCVPEWDEIGRQIMVEMDDDARVELWDQWWEYWLEEAATITLYLVEGFVGLNTAEFELDTRANGRHIFRHNLRLRR
jgi:peptide/nickel transport system substrate-binding protein